MDKKTVTNEVMEVYQKENPSFVEGLISEKSTQDYINRWISFFTEKLAIPPLLFKRSTLLDVGCGSGEKNAYPGKAGSHHHRKRSESGGD